MIDLRDYYLQHPEKLIGGEGLTIYGAVLGAALGIWVYSQFAKAKFKFSYLADVIAPGIVLAQAIGRVGCTINGCCYGHGDHAPVGLRVQPPERPRAARRGHPAGGRLRNPLPGVDVRVAAVAAGRLKPDGSIFLVYLSLYAVWRLASDFLRPDTPFLFGLHQAQVISIVVLVDLPAAARLADAYHEAARWPRPPRRSGQLHPRPLSERLVEYHAGRHRGVE